MKAIAVFCGSRNGASMVYREGAIALGRALAEREITLVYGGASVGLMGAAANAVMEAGGKVIGIIPEFLETREVSHRSLSELIVVDSMHERKTKMAELANAFIALPGGPGTMEEYFEIFTWAQLGLHAKPCGLLNIHHYFDPLVALLDHMHKEQFMAEEHRSIALTDTTAEGLLDQFSRYEPPAVTPYITRQKQT